MITATIEILGKKYKAEGKTTSEALAGLSYKGFARLKSVLTVKSKDKEKIIILYPVQTLRLFSLSTQMKTLAIKQIAMRFD